MGKLCLCLTLLFGHCAHCLPTAVQLLLLAASLSGSLHRARRQSSWAPPAALELSIASRLVCAFLYFCVLFAFFNTSIDDWNWSEIKLHTICPRSQHLSAFPPPAPAWCQLSKQLLLLSNEWNAIKLMSIHVYSGWLDAWMHAWLTKPHGAILGHNNNNNNRSNNNDNVKYKYSTYELAKCKWISSTNDECYWVRALDVAMRECAHLSSCG